MKCNAGFLILQLLLLATLIEITTAGTHCKDENGNEVDWFIIYKLPNGSSTHPNSAKLHTGERFYFMDSKRDEKWSLSEISIKDTKQPLSTTLQQVYMKTNVMYLMYNDDPPDKKSSDVYAHAKGVAAFDKKTGFWLIHSVPGFPPKQIYKYVYPKSGLMFGQTFLCVSFTTPNLLSIVKLMRVNRVQIYDYYVPEIFSKDPNAELKKLINDEPFGRTIYHLRRFLYSIDRIPFRGFAKSARYGEDLYDALVAPTLKCNMAVETWRRPTTLPNYFGAYKVFNVEAVKMPNRTSTMSNYYFNATQDHSKFAVCINNLGDWVCIGDINRAKSQKNRGGGTLCFRHRQVADAFRNATYCQGCDAQNLCPSFFNFSFYNLK